MGFSGPADERGFIKKLNPPNQSKLEETMGPQSKKIRLRSRKNHGWYQSLREGVGGGRGWGSTEQMRWWITFKETSQQYMEISDTMKIVFQASNPGSRLALRVREI